MREKFIKAAIKYEGSYEKIALSIKNNEKIEGISYQRPAITILDEEYPASLKQLRYPPFVLFYKGNPELLNHCAVSIIGSRMPEAYGIDMTRRIVAHCNKNYVIVSGLAKGIDAIVHKEALSLKRRTIGVIGCGIDRIYPLENEDLYCEMSKFGLILSEYPAFTPPRKHHFPFRNRLIAALGNKCIVTSATLKSGTMLTVNEALSLDKEVICIPYPIGSSSGEGCNLLISQGASILTNTADFAMI
jgi:DNA processing protein